MRKVRVQLTNFADPVEVDVDELPGLQAQGLLVAWEGETSDLADAADPAGASAQPDAPPAGDSAPAGDTRKAASPKGGKSATAGGTPAQ